MPVREDEVGGGSAGHSIFFLAELFDDGLGRARKVYVRADFVLYWRSPRVVLKDFKTSPKVHLVTDTTPGVPVLDVFTYLFYLWPIYGRTRCSQHLDKERIVIRC